MEHEVKRLIQTKIRPDGAREIHSWAHRKGGRMIKRIVPEAGDGLRIWDKEKTAPGYVLYSPDHSNKFLLIDMSGDIVHEWPAWTSHFGYMLPNGHLLLDTQFAPDREYGIVELDWAGREVGFIPCQVHHDFQRMANGNTMIVCDREIECPEIHPGAVLDSYLIEVDPRGRTVWEWHSAEHLEELKRLAGVAFPRDDPDWTHTNTVQVLPETPASRDARFKPGNIMISHRNLDVALVIERETGRVVWAWGPGFLDKQHATHILPTGNMLCFDNGRARGWSAIWEIEPISGRVVWSYKGEPPESFFADALSNAQRLSNGNTFVCSGSRPDCGRLFEVTPQGEIVWEFQNPFAAYAEGEKIVYRAYKYDPQIVESLLKA